MATKKPAAVAEDAAVTAGGVPAPKAVPEDNPVPQTAAKKPDAESAGFCVYIGPTINGVIQSGTIYPGNMADALKSAALAVEKYPLAANLIVTGDTLAVDRIKVKTPGNLLYVNYAKLASGKNK